MNGNNDAGPLIESKHLGRPPGAHSVVTNLERERRQSKRSSLRADVAILLSMNALALLAFALWHVWHLDQYLQDRTAFEQMVGQREVLARFVPERMTAAQRPANTEAPPQDFRLHAARADQLIAQWSVAMKLGEPAAALQQRTEQFLASTGPNMAHWRSALDEARFRVFGIVVLFLAGFLTLQLYAYRAFQRQVARPLAQLAGRADRLASGLPDQRVLSTHARRELHVIGRALDGVAERDNQLSDLLHTDEATGLPNRRAGRQQLAEWVRKNVTGAIIMLRIINLSGIRAVYGEAHANAVLYRYSRAVHDAAAQWADSIAVYSEDVLMLLVPSGAKGAEAALSEIVDELMRTQFDDNESFERLARPELAASIALFPVHGDTVDAALGQATAALDAATARGAGAIERASEAGAGALRDRLLHNEAIRTKLESEDLALWFMPVVDVGTDPPHTCHLEALMRMRNENGEVQPLPHELMERLLSTPELLLPASERCFRYACDVVHELHQDGYEVNMAFNLSATELRDEHLARLAQIFSESKVPFGALTLEITERAALRGFEKLVPRLQNMRDRGVRVILDDFGTGFSSMSHLVELPIDGLKIDRTFVQDLEGDERSREIVAATAALARVLHLEVIVEGVETAGQRDLLRELGCPLHQGYLYSRAMPAEKLRGWLTAESGTTPSRQRQRA